MNKQHVVNEQTSALLLGGGDWGWSHSAAGLPQGRGMWGPRLGTAVKPMWGWERRRKGGEEGG